MRHKSLTNLCMLQHTHIDGILALCKSNTVLSQPYTSCQISVMSRAHSDFFPSMAPIVPCGSVQMPCHAPP